MGQVGTTRTLGGEDKLEGGALSAWYDTSPRHVLFVSDGACIRVLKQAAALTQLGWRVDSLSMRAPAMREVFGSVVVERNEGRFPDLIAASGASIIHVHNEPDVLMRYAHFGAKGRPVVYDVHDLEYHHFDRVTEDEAWAFDHADGIVHVGEAYRDFTATLHRWSVPDAVVHSLPVRGFTPRFDRWGRCGVCYQGGVSRPGEMLWRDLRPVFDAFTEAEIPFLLYTREPARQWYPRDQVTGWLPYDRMLRGLTRHVFGFVGSAHADEKTLIGYPNKYGEYMQAGVIPVVLCQPTSYEFWNGAGLYAETMPELIEQMEACDIEHEQARVAARMKWMDDEIVALTDLYGRLT